MANEIDLKLTDDCSDLLIVNGDLVLVSGPDELVQRLTVKLKWFYGEYAFNTSLGVDYHGSVFVKNPNIPRIDAMLKAEILADSDVVRLVTYSSEYNPTLRTFKVTFQVQSVYEEVSTPIIVEV